MSESASSGPGRDDSAAGAPELESAELTPEQMRSALFVQLVMQQSNLALMLMGNTPHPETGRRMRDLDAAKLFIDQLEMIEVKTKGNLDARESALLKQNLMALRLAFVEAVNAPEPPAGPAEPGGDTAGKASPAGENKTAPAADTGAPGDEETKKRFSKKYSA